MATLKRRLLQSTWRDKNFNYRLNHLPKESMEEPVRLKAFSATTALPSWVHHPPPVSHLTSTNLTTANNSTLRSSSRFPSHKNFSEETACWELSNDFLTEASALSGVMKHNTQFEDTTPPKHKDLPKEREQECFNPLQVWDKRQRSTVILATLADGFIGAPIDCGKGQKRSRLKSLNVSMCHALVFSALSLCVSALSLPQLG